MSEHSELTEEELKHKFPHRYTNPKIHPSVFIAPGAQVFGDVEIGADSSLWFNSIVRGDVNFIRIGERTNIQDLSMIHVSYHGHPTIIGNGVTIGHASILHACTIGDYALIGMGTQILDGVEIGEYSLIGAGSLVTKGTKIPPRTQAFGRPAKVTGELTEKQIEHLRWSARHYVNLARTYRAPAPKGRLGI
jgi:carbonic anhydrase/acetyltransferase-like protein (isoleucine patch superfamily)